MKRFRPRAVLRGGPVVIQEGEWDGIAAVAKLVPPVRPWLDPRSSFHGGRGLLPPFRPLLLHEAEAWRAVDPARVLHADVGPEGTWLVVRRVPFEEPVGLDAEGLLRELLSRVARLHARDVLHRDLRPDHVVPSPDGWRIIDLDLARYRGLGAVGPIGSSRWRAPEMMRAEADGRSDLYAVAHIVRAVAGARGLRLGRAASSLLSAMAAPSPGDRPTSAREALRELGGDAEPPNLSPPHSRAELWWRWTALHLAIREGDPWRLTRLADRAASEVDPVALVAGVQLAGAPTGGAEAWLALAATLWILHERTGDDLYLEQCREARFHAHAGWHPASAALAALEQAGTPAREVVRAKVTLRMLEGAMETAVQARDAGGVALAAWRLGDDERLRRALESAGRGDPLAAAVAASRLLMQAGGRVPPVVARHALPEDQLEAVRRLVASHRFDEAAELASAFPGDRRLRASMVIHLARGQEEEAARLARELAEGGWWDAAVAALLARAEDGPVELRRRAEETLLSLLATDAAPVARLVNDDSGREGHARPPGPEVAEGLLAVPRDLIGSEDVVSEVLVALLLQFAGEDGDVERVLAGLADDAPVVADYLRAVLALRRDGAETARAVLEELEAREPGLPSTWLVRALVEPDARTARDALETAALLGAHPTWVERVKAWRFAGGG